MEKNKIPEFVKYLIFLLIGIGIGYFIKNNHVSEINNQTQQTEISIQKNSDSKSQNSTQNTDFGTQKDFPKYVIETLDYVSKYQKAPDGYVGGRKFKNLEKLLPQKSDNGQRINYQEWDVHEHIDGQNRGAERLVTGDDGSAYFTEDHYDSFKKIR
jgi:ribonuclease T1